MDAEAREVFLLALAETAHVGRAVEACGVPVQTIYNWKGRASAKPRATGKVEGFSEAWEAALELGTDRLEDEAVRRGVHGTLKPVYQGGKKVGDVREFSDILLIFMLKARRPERFKERFAGELSGPGGGPIEHKDVAARDVLASRIAGLASRQRPANDPGQPERRAG